DLPPRLSMLSAFGGLDCIVETLAIHFGHCRSGMARGFRRGLQHLFGPSESLDPSGSIPSRPSGRVDGLAKLARPGRERLSVQEIGSVVFQTDLDDADGFRGELRLLGAIRRAHQKFGRTTVKRPQGMRPLVEKDRRLAMQLSIPNKRIALAIRDVFQG